jgi:hypothetical protein
LFSARRSVTSIGVETLGRVADPRALDACDRGRARLRVEVPASWLAAGAALEIAAPLRLACARCDGGGCDGCARSGVLRAPEDAAGRTVVASVPAQRGAEGVALRIPEPFGPAHPIAQLLLEVRAAEAASPGVRRLDPPAPAAAPHGLRPVAFAAVVLALLTAVAALLSR